jgi:hypothetical protein
VPQVIKSTRKSSIVLALYYGVVSILIILFGSPLFRVLSFEYSSLVALFGSLPVMWFAARYAQEHKGERTISILKIVWLTILPASILPVVLSLIFVRSCDTFYGLGYYAQIVLPSILVGTTFGAACGSWAKTRRSRITCVLGIWLFTFLLSLLPGYVSPRIFTYGWQYGYFPGFVWDEYIEFDYTAMVGYFLLASAVLAAVKPIAERGSFWKSLIASHANVFLIAYVLFFFVYDMLFGSLLDGLSHHNVERFLSNEVHAGSVTVHLAGGYSKENQGVIRLEIHEHLKEIASLYPSIDTSMEVDVYLYPNSESLYHYVGTRRASIAKPWLGTLHIAEENLSSLKHELVHLLLKPYGNFPIYASWSTGLTEGAAVAVEDDYDGLRTADDLAAWAMRMQFADGVTPLMQFTGFASTASAASYVLTGSFSKYLLAKYGSEKYLQLYHDRDYEAAYGKTLEDLDKEWSQSLLSSNTMNSSDSVIARYYFERSSIVNQACLRRIGRLLHEAQEAYSAEQFAEAYDLYKQAYTEDSTRLDAVRGMVMAKLKQLQFQFYDAAAILDSGTVMHRSNGKVLLSSLRGDVHFLAFGDKNEMKAHYDDAIRYAANDVRFVSAVGLRMLLEDSIFDVHKFLFFRYDLELREPYTTQTYDDNGIRIKSGIPQALYEHAWESVMPDSVRVGYILLRTLFNESRGEYSAAIHEWTALPVFVDPAKLSPNVRKAYDIIDKKVRRWMKALDLE